MFSIEEMLKYLSWADGVIFKEISMLSDDEISHDYGGAKSIRFRLLHLAEEHLAWHYDLMKQSWTKEIRKINNMSNQELMSFIKDYHKIWLEFSNSKKGELFVITEDVGTVVEISIEQVIFNLINHTTYHRGQIVTILRMADHSTPITDYYWYLIHCLQNS